MKWCSITLAAIFTAGAAPGALVMEMVQPGGSPNATLTVSQAIGESPEIFALETTGAVLADRIEMRYPASLSFHLDQLEADWSHQSTTTFEGLDEIGVTIYDFLGSDPASSSESYSFYQPWSATFSFTDPVGGNTAVDVPVRVDVFASAVVPGSGFVSVSATDSFVVTIPEPGPTLLCVLGGIVMVFARRRSLASRAVKGQARDG